MLEPISTISNVAFILFGLVVFKRSRYVGFITILLGVASGGWHWFMNPFWHAFDISMMYFMLIGLINYSLGSEYTKAALLASIGMVGLYFVVPSHLIIGGMAIALFLSLFRHYQPGRIFIIIACFALWITTNIPYLHQWNIPIWRLDLLHGISHIFAALGIYKVISYKPTTFFELTRKFKSLHLPSLNEKTRREFERLIDVELNPVLGNRAVEAISQHEISRFLGTVTINQESLAMVNGAGSKLHQILEFATGRGIKHNLVAESS